MTSVVNAATVYLESRPRPGVVKLYRAKYRSSADIAVWRAKYASQASGDSRWHFVRYPSQAEFRVAFVSYASQADLQVYFVDYASQAGWVGAPRPIP